MKKEQFDDPRLVEHMVKYGRVMGIGEIARFHVHSICTKPARV